MSLSKNAALRGVRSDAFSRRFGFRVSAGLLRVLGVVSLGSMLLGACGARALPSDDEEDPRGIGGNGGSSGSGLIFGGSGGTAASGGSSFGGRSGSSGSGSSGSGGGTVGGGGSGSVVPGSCRGDERLGNGFVRCASGMLHRTGSPSACESQLPRASAFTPDELIELQQIVIDRGLTIEEVAVLVPCFEDSHCTDAPNGYCRSSGGRTDALTYCAYGCTRDDDCGSGSVCLCGDEIGTCVNALCTSNRDCAGELRCTAYDWLAGCDESGVVFSCQTYADECASDADCGGSTPYCQSVGEHRACQAGACPIIGRPFLMERPSPTHQTGVAAGDQSLPG